MQRDLWLPVGAAALLLSVASVDAVSGRLLHATQNPTWWLAMLAGHQVARLLSRRGTAEGDIDDTVMDHAMEVAGIGMAAGVVYFATFEAVAFLLTGWNGATPWAPGRLDIATAVMGCIGGTAIVAAASYRSARARSHQHGHLMS